ncbi:aromatic amino acid transaminase [Pseudoxanthomonas sp. CF125]|uniref:aromatic amino acid transaminase n=1 Tax=Pseudoxanthomonas sp. CF125 TaxID=1855303 RepID=UPI00088A4B40|nr:aromatic amino acid transaminase [Pseudoxanthomonas sp. CF125]SDQ81416.1 aromatic-amino-acid transaminase [Pseudoxanthomonas sp. CF125]
MFDRLPIAKTDSLMELAALMQADPRAGKIDLGIGTYRDEDGAIPIMAVVKEAERTLLIEQTSKGYLGLAGDGEFALRLQGAIFPGLEAAMQGRLARIQTPGGTGALRLALETVAQANPKAQVWLGVPSWPAHVPLISAVGLIPRTFRHLNIDGQIDLAAMYSALEQARAGDIILLHGCCHNPTGTDLPLDAWRAVANVASSKGLTPLLDLAYAGLGDDLEADVRGVRELLLRCESALIAVSCSKSFGLYRDRTGMLVLLGESPAITLNLSRTAASNARLLWSNPPDHGAAVVKSVLASAELTQSWHAELNHMRSRVNAIRARLADLPLPRLNLGALKRQRGMFAMLPLSADEVRVLRERHGIYIDVSGRINVAGLNEANFAKFASALTAIDVI